MSNQNQNEDEAFQCRLNGGPFDGKFVLVPKEPLSSDVPRFIPDEWFQRENPRLFDEANEQGEIYDFDYHVVQKWYWRRNAS